MCKSCAERRRAILDAYMEGEMRKALGHVVDGAAELVGLKEKEKKDGRDRRT